VAGEVGLALRWGLLGTAFPEWAAGRDCRLGRRVGGGSAGLVDFPAASPFRGIGLHSKRYKERPRDIEL
jgi:hypothetical protein